jgi:phage shock protein C
MIYRDPITDSPNPHRLYRNRDEGVIAGVCAGIADYVGMRVWQVRAIALIALAIAPPPTLIVYLILAIVLRSRPARLYRNQEEERFWQSVSLKPTGTFQGLRHTFRDLEARLADMERAVTSSEFKLDREIRGLDR